MEDGGEHAEDVEGRPGDKQEEQRDGIHLGRPPLLPRNHLASAGHLPPHAGSEVVDDGALPGQDRLRLGRAGPGDPGQAPHVGLTEVEGNESLTVSNTERTAPSSFRLSRYNDQWNKSQFEREICQILLLLNLIFY